MLYDNRNIHPIHLGNRLTVQTIRGIKGSIIARALPGEFFDRYLCEGDPMMFINIGEFLKFLDRVERDEQVKIRLDEERARLVIQCIRPGHTRRFEMAILEPLDEEVPQPKILFKSSTARARAPRNSSKERRSSTARAHGSAPFYFSIYFFLLPFHILYYYNRVLKCPHALLEMCVRARGFDSPLLTVVV